MHGDNVDTVVVGPDISTRSELEEVRRARRRPRVTQPDYLHLRILADGLRDAVANVPGPVHDVLDVWCGSRPYDDLLPAGARCIGIDVEGNPYGVADVVTSELLPFPSESFDLVLCIQAFQYMPDPGHAISEFARVLRPGGTALVALVFAFEYDRSSAFEARYTEHQLRSAFSNWHDVRVHENGGRTVSWGVLTGSLLFGLEQRTSGLLRKTLHPAFAVSYAAINGVAAAVGRLERADGGSVALPMNLTLTARTPVR